MIEEDIGVDVLKGRTLVRAFRGEYDDDDALFFVTEGEPSRAYKMYHDRDCCEHVSIEDIVGDLNDIIGSPILTAESRSNYKETDDGDETWTFYEIATVKGSVTIRWYGESNGYYSTSVSFESTDNVPEPSND